MCAEFLILETEKNKTELIYAFNIGTVGPKWNLSF